MRLVSPYTLCAFIIIWTFFFLFMSRHFLFNAHQVSRVHVPTNSTSVVSFQYIINVQLSKSEVQ